MTFDPQQPPVPQHSAAREAVGSDAESSTPAASPTAAPAPPAAPTPPMHTPPPHPHALPMRKPFNALALIAFVGSFFISLAGIVCGHISLSQIKRTQERGRGFALAGVILGYVGLAVKLLLVALFFGFGLSFAGLAASAGGLPNAPTAEGSISRGPEGMASGGAVFGEGSRLVSQGFATGDSRTPFAVDRDRDPVDVVIYVDYMCPACGAFEASYGDVLSEGVETGDITLQVYPVNFLDPTSQGTRYSTRAANLFACTVENDPDAAFDVHTALLSRGIQPSEGTPGLSDEELVAVAKSAGADVTPQVQQCVEAVPFAAFFDDNTRIATQIGLLGLAEGSRLNGHGGELQPSGEPQLLVGTPTVIVSGEEYSEMRDGDLADVLAKAVAQQR